MKKITTNYWSLGVSDAYLWDPFSWLNRSPCCDMLPGRSPTSPSHLELTVLTGSWQGGGAWLKLQGKCICGEQTEFLFLFLNLFSVSGSNQQKASQPTSWNPYILETYKWSIEDQVGWKYDFALCACVRVRKREERETLWEAGERGGEAIRTWGEQSPPASWVKRCSSALCPAPSECGFPPRPAPNSE